ncbi:hypothetical protein B0T19DRAFT_230508 [Cercophora scortea]|uniref:Uncharacterized protein n=1 Tax=Cercophora scortea TaxID=314031 RepID=A0AAE0MAE2_9PEZI|nr:hypothetical protein B0T19DRAFT_230508 [Cercophora scortea]
MARYAEAHASPKGPGDARPTALQIIKDEGLEGKLSDKVMLITGTSAGIGIETARALAATGAKLFLAVRNLEKGKAACADFLEPGRVELLELDTSKLASVRACAAAFLEKSSQLNVLVCNAAIMNTPTREETEDGFEGQLATNYLGHFLLFWLLKDTLLKSSTPDFNSRLVNVSSSAHHATELFLDDFNIEKPGAYVPETAYGHSKLAQIYMANYVDRHFGPQGLHALSLMPGGMDTNLAKHIPREVMEGFKKNPVLYAFMKDNAQGAATTVWAAVSKEWEGKGGEYLENCQVATAEPFMPGLMGAKPYVHDEEKEEKAWAITLKMLGLS